MQVNRLKLAVSFSGNEEIIKYIARGEYRCSGCITFGGENFYNQSFTTMRKFLLLAIIFGFTGCHYQKNEITRLSTIKDSLYVATAEKDSAILDFLKAFNEIQENLDSIKKLEKIVTVARDQQGEMRGSRKQQISEDLALLNQLIQKNRELNASLQKKLGSANSRIGQLEGMVSEFQRMVTLLNSQVEQKDVEIAQLSRDIGRLNSDIAQLAGEVISIRQDAQYKAQVIEQQTEAINKVYYAMGSVKELTHNEVLEKSGGVLGMGRTLKIRKDFNREYFTPSDMRELTYLPLHAKKARLISVHPMGSYRISGTKSADTLYIEDSREFWKASKYLLLVVD
jgi:peptidoglycan hydrolase CwlO-like protein